MKKQSLLTSPILSLAFVSLFSLLLPSCARFEELQSWDSVEHEKKSDVDPDPDIPEEDGKIVTFSVGLTPGDETLVDIEALDNGSLHTKWVEGDQIRVVSLDESGAVVDGGENIFNIQEGFTDHQASFTGKKVVGSRYVIFFPSNLSYGQLEDLTFNGITQTANNSTSHLKYGSSLYGLTIHPSDLPDASVSFSEDFVYAYRETMGLTLHKSSFIHNRFGLPASTKSVQRVEMEALQVNDVTGSELIFHSSNLEKDVTSTLVLYLNDVTPVVNEKGNKVIDTYMSIPWWGYTMQPNQRICFSVYYTDNSDVKQVVTKTMTNSEGKVTKAYNGLCVHNNINLINVTPSASSEDGTAENPFLLSTASDLLSIKSRLREGDGEDVYFRMENDIDLAGINWVPISNTAPYNRRIQFDGNGKIIYNMRCTDQEYASFFGVLIGECHDLGFVNAHVEGNGTYCGIIAGYMGSRGVNSGAGVLNRCFADGKVLAAQTSSGIGGLVGAMGYPNVGSNVSQINDCYCSALLENNNGTCGGLAASILKGSQINRSYFCGALNTLYNNVGGLVGAGSAVGGVIPSITDCAVLPKVFYNSRTGSIAAGLYENIVGGGADGHTITNTKIWDGILGRPRNDGVGSDDLSSIQSQFAAFSAWSSTTGLNGEPLLNWVVERGDYNQAPAASVGGNDPAVWEGATTNSGIRSYYFDCGTGEAADEPYLISQTFQLYQMETKMKALREEAGGSVSTSYFKLGADIDMTPVAWDPLNNDSSAYYDKMYIDFDGNGKTIDHLSCNAEVFPSFFGVLNGNVRNLSFDHATITGGSSNGCAVVGAYLGSGGGCSSSAERITISNSTVSGSNSSYRGALAGSINKNGSTVKDISVLNCTVSGGTGTYIGGMIGHVGADATLSGKNLVSGTSVSGNGTTGGVIGGVANVTANVNVSGCTYMGGSVTSTGRYSGGLAGMTGTSSTTIFSDCHVENATVDLTGCAGLATVLGGGFVGILSQNCEAKGCSVGTADQPVSVLTAQPSASSYKLTVGGFVGEHNGTVTRNGNVRTKAYVTISCSNTEDRELRLGGFCGYPSNATIEYTDVVATMTGLTGRNIAGLCGNINGACKIDHCTVTANVSGSSNVGGLVGWINGGAACTITNCTVSGSVTASQGSVGGLAGVQNSAAATITDFSSSMNVTSRGQYSGGMAGKISGGTLTRCAVSGNVSCTNVATGNDSLAGGLFGQAQPDSVSTLTISCCAFTGNITASGRMVGGLIGANNGKGTMTVSDCLVSGNVTAGGQWGGGILGSHAKGTSNLTNCLVTGSVTGLSGAGGIYGGNKNIAGLSLIRCMAYNSSIRGTNTSGAADDYATFSCGAILGYHRGAVVVNYCYRKPGLDFLDCQPTNRGNVLVDNDFITSAAAIPQRYTGYSYSHHGKENPKATLSALVTSGEIGGDWDSAIWDLGGDIPSLSFLGNIEGYSNPTTIDWGD